MVEGFFELLITSQTFRVKNIQIQYLWNLKDVFKNSHIFYSSRKVRDISMTNKKSLLLTVTWQYITRNKIINDVFNAELVFWCLKSWNLWIFVISAWCNDCNPKEVA